MSRKRPALAAIVAAQGEQQDRRARVVDRQCDKVLIRRRMIFTFYKARGWRWAKAWFARRPSSTWPRSLEPRPRPRACSCLLPQRCRCSPRRLSPDANTPHYHPAVDAIPDLAGWASTIARIHSRPFQEALADANVILGTGRLGVFELRQIAPGTHGCGPHPRRAERPRAAARSSACGLRGGRRERWVWRRK